MVVVLTSLWTTGTMTNWDATEGLLVLGKKKHFGRHDVARSLSCLPVTRGPKINTWQSF